MRVSDDALVRALPARRRPEHGYTIKVMPPGGPAPRLADGHPDLVRPLVPQWCRPGRQRPLRRRPGRSRDVRSQGDARRTAGVPALGVAKKSSRMTPTELELSKSSVNCMPRGVPAIWLQNPYTTLMVHKPGLLVQLYEVLNNWRVIHLDGRPLPKDPEPFFHGNSAARWEGDTLVVESIGFDERTYIMPNGWFHSDELRVTERYTPAFHELPHRRDHRRRSEGAGEAVEIRPSPLDAGRWGGLRVLLHEQQGARGARKTASAGAAEEVVRAFRPAGDMPSPTSRPGTGTIPFAGGAAFRVWAHLSLKLASAGTFNQWNVTATPLAKRE